MSLLTLNEGTKVYSNVTQSFPKSAPSPAPVSLPNHWHSVSAEVAGTTASNVYKPTPFSISLCSQCTFLALIFGNDTVKITTTPVPPCPTHRQACPLTMNQACKVFSFPFVQDVSSSTPVSTLLTPFLVNAPLMDPNYQYCRHAQTCPKPTVNP